MIRRQVVPRTGWQKRVEEMGFLFHTPDGETYWNESVCYEFTSKEIDTLESATNSLQEICAEAVDTVIQKGWYERMGISRLEVPLIEKSWKEERPAVYGRFDISWRPDSPPKMLEYNADTPTSLFEAAVIQWSWLKDAYPQYDQFNSIHEKLISRWKRAANPLHLLYFCCLQGQPDDITQTEYLRDTCHQAGLQTQFIFIEDIGFDHKNNFFVDLDSARIQQCFKLYPWEWLTQESFGSHLAKSEINFIEPAWKRVMSTKAFSAILWELFPNHPHLLPSFFERPVSGKFVEKPFVSREGQRIKIWDSGRVVSETDGALEASGSVFQAYHELPKFDDRFPVIGSWVIGEESSGIGIREDSNIITQTGSHFIPHYIKD